MLKIGGHGPWVLPPTTIPCKIERYPAWGYWTRLIRGKRLKERFLQDFRIKLLRKFFCCNFLSLPFKLWVVFGIRTPFSGTCKYQRLYAYGTVAQPGICFGGGQSPTSSELHL